MSNVKVLDLDKLTPDKRVVKLAGEEIDVSKIPSRVTMELTEKAKMFEEESTESWDALLDMVIKIMKPSKPDVTKDWIIDNTEINQLMALVNFVVEPIKEKIQETQEEVEGKN